MSRTLALLLVCGVAAAAPVPKPKLTDVYGEVTDPKGECKFEMNKDGALTVTVPVTHPAAEPGGAGWTTPPLLSKPVKGDFVLTVRITTHLPKGAEKREKAATPQVMAGVSVADATNPRLVGLNAGTVFRFENAEWMPRRYTDYRHLKIGGLANLPFKPQTTSTYLRVTRREGQMTIEMSSNGTDWRQVITKELVGLSDTIDVGPVTYGCIDREFSVTFDQYEIKPLKDK